MKIAEILNQPENRKIEFKREMPKSIDLCKTIISFANDAGGTLFIGIQDTPRKIVGIREESLIKLEEKISNIIHDNCSPIILPEIMFLNYNGKHVISVKIYKGNNPPYHIKSKGIEKGTYIRVGSSNRLANSEIIENLKLRKENISFDSLPVYEKDLRNINFVYFKEQFQKITGEKLNDGILRKLNLIVEEQGQKLPTNALVLLSNDPIRKKIFPYAKIECARFKGKTPGEFIDQKTIDDPISFQPEEAYKFILRHISEGSEYKGIYRKDRWEYPIIAIREVVRNAVIHRDYSLKGKDIKIAIFDDKIEITSPGKLLPTVDFDDMEAGQSDIRNKILAPVFKKLGIIEQWGNGLQLISKELKKYPEIRFTWSEPGISFRVSFIKKELTKRPITTDYDRLRPITTDYDRLSRENRETLLYLLDNDKITKKDVVNLLNCGETKAKTILKDLLKMNLIVRIGKGRNTHYCLKKKYKDF